MLALLDVNVLIALLDRDHSSHAAARGWMVQHGAAGWATCPITQNGCIRVMASPGYPNALAVHAVVERLRRATSDPLHEFWPDDLPVNSKVIAGVVGHRQVTDSYLCHLASGRHARLATFDRALAATHPDVAMLVPIG